MSRVLLAYATGEGQTARVADTLARELRVCGDDVSVTELDNDGPARNLKSVDAVIVAASVHAGKHQDCAVHFVQAHRDELADKRTAFLSVSLSAAADEEAGRTRAAEQLQTFLKDTEWSPDYAETVAGAFRLSRFSRLWQWVIRASEVLFRGELRRQGWPSLTVDREYTDWSVLRRFATDFSNSID